MRLISYCVCATLLVILLSGCVMTAPDDTTQTTFPTQITETTTPETQPNETTQPTTIPTESVEDYSPNRFLTDLNLNGSFYPSDEQVPTGKLENI